MEQLPRHWLEAVLIWTVLAALFLVATCSVVVELLYRLAIRRKWRVGAWAKKIWGDKTWRLEMSDGTRFRAHGECRRCGTPWKFVDPHIVVVNPYGQTYAVCPFCQKCHKGFEPSQLVDAYMAWWVDNRDEMAAKGEDAPDIREWRAIETALRNERSPERVAYA